MLKYLFSDSYGRDFSESGSVISGKVGSFVINLDRATERWNFIKRSVEALGFQTARISAEDGNLLSDDYINSISDKERYRRYFKMYPEKGTIGCSLSHEKAWKEFLLSDCEFALIFEDDASFDPSVLKNCVEDAIKYRQLWDVLELEPYHHGSPVAIRRINASHSMCVYFSNITHAGCYLINRATARKFLQKMYPIFVPLDHYINAAWEFDVKYIGVEPRVVRQRTCASQIKTTSSKKFSDIRTICSNALYNIRRSVVWFLYSCYIKITLCKN
ncbi:MAG: glycosyltransferase family 25 protein [Alphaproteobacteria bacterium]|nr:glycosyltransferase family 25 protein [Alphaproteobacteria bacterium]